MKRKLIFLSRFVIIIGLFILINMIIQMIITYNSAEYRVSQYVKQYGWEGIIHVQTDDGTKRWISLLKESGHVKLLENATRELGINTLDINKYKTEQLRYVIINDLNHSGIKLNDNNITLELELFFRKGNYSKPILAGLYVQNLYHSPYVQYYPVNISHGELKELIYQMNNEVLESQY